MDMVAARTVLIYALMLLMIRIMGDLAGDAIYGRISPR
jgi:hypothetical protein